MRLPTEPRYGGARCTPADGADKSYAVKPVKLYSIIPHEDWHRGGSHN